MPGTNKQLLDQKVHELLEEDVEAPPPPYSAAEYGLALPSKHLAGKKLSVRQTDTSRQAAIGCKMIIKGISSLVL